MAYVEKMTMAMADAIREAIPPEVVKHWALMQEAVRASGQALKLWGEVVSPAVALVLFCVRGLVDIVNPLWPVIWRGIKAAAWWLWEVTWRHVWPFIVATAEATWGQLQQQDPWTVLLLATLVLLVLSVWYAIRWARRQQYTTRVRMQIKRTGQKLRHYVQAAMDNLGKLRQTWHLVFACHLAFYLREQSWDDTELQRSVIFWVCAIVVPSILSFRELHAAQGQGTGYKGVVRWLKYWAVIGCGWAITELPLVETLVGSLPLIMACRVHVVVWLWLWYTDGASIVYDLAAPTMHRMLLQWLPANHFMSNKVLPGVGAWMLAASPARMQGLLGGLGETIDLYMDLWPVMPCVPVIFMAGWFNAWAAWYCGLLFPMYRMANAMARGPSPDEGSGQAPHHAKYHMRWLTYWTVFAPYKMVHHHIGRQLSGLIGWYNVYNATVLWLLFGLAAHIVRALDEVCRWQPPTPIAKPSRNGHTLWQPSGPQQPDAQATHAAPAGQPITAEYPVARPMLQNEAAMGRNRQGTLRAVATDTGRVERRR